MLKELHPTPAVCGLPKAEAYAFIPENEGYERRYYSGFIGWLDPEGATAISVNLRCMEIRSNEAKLYAGGGILASSEVQMEWEETEEKLKSLDITVREQQHLLATINGLKTTERYNVQKEISTAERSIFSLQSKLSKLNNN